MNEFHYVRITGNEGGVDAIRGRPRGVDLGSILQSGLPPLKVALEIVAALCEILAIAEEDGELHGDIGPESIFLDRDGMVSVDGYGLRRSWSRAPERVPMAPYTDRYGLGYTAFRLLSGRDLDANSEDAERHDNAVIDSVILIHAEDLPEAMAGDIQWFLAKLMLFEPRERPTAIHAWRTFIAFADDAVGERLEAWCAGAVRGRAPRRELSQPFPIPGHGEDLASPQIARGPMQTGQMNFSAMKEEFAQSTAFWSRDQLRAAIEPDEETGFHPAIGGGTATSFWTKEQLEAMAQGREDAPRPKRRGETGELRLPTPPLESDSLPSSFGSDPYFEEESAETEIIQGPALRERMKAMREEWEQAESEPIPELPLQAPKPAPIPEPAPVAPQEPKVAFVPDPVPPKPTSTPRTPQPVDPAPASRERRSPVPRAEPVASKPVDRDYVPPVEVAPLKSPAGLPASPAWPSASLGESSEETPSYLRPTPAPTPSPESSAPRRNEPALPSTFEESEKKKKDEGRRRRQSEPSWIDWVYGQTQGISRKQLVIKAEDDDDTEEVESVVGGTVVPLLGLVATFIAGILLVVMFLGGLAFIQQLNDQRPVKPVNVERPERPSIEDLKSQPVRPGDPDRGTNPTGTSPKPSPGSDSETPEIELPTPTPQPSAAGVQRAKIKFSVQGRGTVQCGDGLRTSIDTRESVYVDVSEGRVLCMVKLENEHLCKGYVDRSGSCTCRLTSETLSCR